jgi:pyoverdine/dityrosine biosynthesis protein Dit1
MNTLLQALDNGCEYRRAFLSSLKHTRLFSWGIVAAEFSFREWRDYQELWIAPQLRTYGRDQAAHISGILLSRKFRKTSSSNRMPEIFRDTIKSRIAHAVQHNLPITIVLPAFPFKTGNAARCSRHLPDLAELGSLCHLWEIIQMVAYRYGPGLRFVLLSDGIALYDAFKVPPYLCELYHTTLQHWITHLGFQSNIELINLQSLLATHFPSFWKELALQEVKQSLPPVDEFSQLFHSLYLNRETDGIEQQLLISALSPLTVGVDTNWKESRKVDVKKATHLYLAFWQHFRQQQIVETLFPGCLRASSTAFHPERNLTLHMLADATCVLPWLGVGVIKQRCSQRTGVITVRYEYQVAGNSSFLPIFLEGEETPFGYIELGG